MNYHLVMGAQSIIEEVDKKFLELSKMSADGKKCNPIFLNSDTDSDVLLKGSIAQPIILSGSTKSLDFNSSIKKILTAVKMKKIIFPMIHHRIQNILFIPEK